MSGINLSSYDLSGINLTNVNLSGANLTGTNLTGANLTKSITGPLNGISNCILPIGYNIIRNDLYQYYIVGPYVTLTGANLIDVDLSNVVELEDNTEHSQEVACSGGKCDII